MFLPEFGLSAGRGTLHAEHGALGDHAVAVLSAFCCSPAFLSLWHADMQLQDTLKS